VCCDCASDDQKARLDNLAIELQSQPTTTAYILVYKNRNSRQQQAKQLLNRAREYLVSQRGIDGARIVTVEGGTRDQNCVELWLVPQGAAPPVPKP
jgi:ribosomal silencing factor RsfS